MNRSMTIEDVDNTVSQLLRTEWQNLYASPLPFDVSFSIPDQSFKTVSNSRPTVDFYLYNICEDLELRDYSPGYGFTENARATVAFPPARVKLTYCVTAWSPAAAGPESEAVRDEHKILSQVLQILFKYKDLTTYVVPQELQQGLEDPLPTTVIIQDEDKNPWDLWNALGGKLKPSLNYSITFPMKYWLAGAEIPLVQTRELELHPPWEILLLKGRVTELVRPGAVSRPADSALQSKPKPVILPVQGAVLKLTRLTPEVPAEPDQAITETVQTNRAGYYSFYGLYKAGYSLEITADGYVNPGTMKINIPHTGGDYNIQLTRAEKK